MNDFYGLGLLKYPILDPMKYRGRGRPRKRDYSLLKELQKRINSSMNTRIKCLKEGT